MARVMLLIEISGTRCGDAWPAPGSIMELSEPEAVQFVRNGWARRLPDLVPEVVETATVPDDSEKAVVGTRRDRR